MKFQNTTKVMLLFLVLLSHSFGVFSQNVKLPEGIAKVASIEGITEYRLNNGLRALHKYSENAE